jgi:hypothetical protein
MGTGYVRNDTANNIANGNVINADDLDGEFNAVEAAFNNSSGHTHDGTTSEGAAIEVIGPSQDIVATASLLRPKTNNAVDLGTTSLKYKDLHMAGTAAIATNATVGGTLGVTGATTLSDTLAVTGNQTNTGNLTVNGNTTLGNAASDTVTVTADVASNIIPSADNTYDLGASGSEWKDLYIDGTANIDTGSIDTANVGTLAVSGNSTMTGNLTVNGSITGSGTIVASTAATLETARTITIAGVTAGAANFDGSANITITTSGLTLGGTAVTSTGAELNILDGVTSSTAELNLLDGVTASTAEINYIDGVTSAIQTQLNAKVDETHTGDVDITGELVVQSYNETYQSVSSSSNTTTINCETGNVFASTLSENTTFTFTNPPANNTAYGFSLKIVQDASASGYTITWPTTIDWPNAVIPTLTGNANAIDQFVFYTHDGGSNWYGFQAGKNLG